MQCRDAQFYLRLRRHAGDELGTDVAADLDRHLAGCPACAADARGAESFDRAVAAAMRAVPIPAGLRDTLLAQVSAHRGTAIRRKLYQAAAVAATVFLALGFGFGIFSASRPKIDSDQIVQQADFLLQSPDAAMRQWLADEKLPPQLPEPFNTDLLTRTGYERVQGAYVPVLEFRHPTELGFAKVYIFRTDGSYNLAGLRDTNASHTMATELPADPRFPGFRYLVVHTVHRVNPGEKPFQHFLGRNG